jgi:hypothetical protein
MKKFKFLFLLISLFVCCDQLSKAQTKVGIFIEKTTGLDDDEQAAYDWFHNSYKPGHGLEKVEFTPDNISNLNANDVKVLWIPINRQGDNESVVKPKAIYDHVETLKKYVQDGGNLYLTNHATLLVSAIRRIADLYKPNTVTYAAAAINTDTWGVNPRFADMDYRGHVLYSDFVAGTKNNLLDDNFFLNSGTSKEDHNCLWTGVSYTDFIKATNSHILGKWSQNGDTNNFGVVEFMPSGDYKGTILCNGLAAYEWDCEGNEFVNNIKKFTENSISYLATIDKKIGFLVPGSDYSQKYKDWGADDDAKALEWFQTFYGAKAKLVTPNDLASLNPAEVPVLWVPINHDGVSAYENIKEVYRNSVDALKSYAQKGGNLYLTNYAALFVEKMGRTNGNDLTEGIYANKYEIKNDSITEEEYKNTTSDGRKDNGKIDNGIRYIIKTNEFTGFDKSGYFPYAGLADATGILKTSQFGLKEHHGIMWMLEGTIVNSKPEKFKKFEEGTHSVIWGLPDLIEDYARASVIEFQPYNEYLGTIFANGDFSYEWDEAARNGEGGLQDGTGKNIFQYNIERYTSNILNHLLETAPADWTYTTTKAPINVDGKGTTYWSTFYASNNRLLPDGVTAYAVKSNNDGRAQLVKVAEGRQVIPGGQGYLLSTANENGFCLTPSEDAPVEVSTENLLMGSDEAMTFNKANYKYYILGKSGEDVGFYWQNGTGGACVNNAAHKAFLRVPASSGAKFLSFTFGEETTGINGITASDAEQNGTALYNLAGQRVAKGYKGLVIKNGKKYLVK